MTWEVEVLEPLFRLCKSFFKRPFWAFTVVLSLGAIAMASGQGEGPEGNGVLLLGTDGDVWAWERSLRGKYSSSTDVQSIVVEVNGTPIEAQWQNGEFVVTIPLEEGPNEVVAVCYCRNGTEYRSNTIVLTQKLKDKPRAVIEVEITDEGILISGANSLVGHSPSRISRYIWEVCTDKNPGSLVLAGSDEELQRAEGERLLIETPAIDGEYYLTLETSDGRERVDRSTTYFIVEDGKARAVDFETEKPSWAKSSVIYGVMPHYFGLEGLRSVMEQLDYLQELGVNALWLSPIYETTYGGHGYDVQDYFTVREDFGTNADLKELVKEAHTRGIRVLLDFVPNHTSSGHRYMVDAEEYGESSSYYDFYDRDARGKPTYYFDWENLPNLNYDNPEVWNWILEAFSYWVRECDVDGFRVDACWGVQYRRPDFWPKWRREMKRIKPDLLLIAEASARDSYNFTHGFDAAYDWTDQLGRWSMENVFEDREHIVERLHRALTNSGKGYHPRATVLRFLENNDTGPRFITRYGLDMTRVAATMLLTLPGIPVIYTGQEDGEEFEPYKYAWPLLWWDEHGLRQHYRELIGLRRSLEALHGDLWEPAGIVTDRQVYGYWRFDDTRSSIALVLLNFSNESEEAMVPIPQGLSSELQDVPWQDARLTRKSHLEFELSKGFLNVSLAPWEQLILVPQR